MKLIQAQIIKAPRLVQTTYGPGLLLIVAILKRVKMLRCGGLMVTVCLITTSIQRLL